MRMLLFAILTAVLLAAVQAPVALAAKTTVDPNAPGTAAQDSEEESATRDARLAQKVTYEAKRVTVLAILDDLTAATGVTLKAGYNAKDWQVRDRKMNITAKEIPLAALMNSIARVMKFKWSRQEVDGVHSYRLYMDRRTLLDAESRRMREEERLERLQAEKRERTLNEWAGAANLSEAELAKLKEENPLLYIGATSGVAGSLASFFGEVPVAGEALATGQEMSLAGSALPPSAQQALLGTMQSMARLEAAFSGRERSIPDDVAANMDQVSIQLNRGLSMARMSPMGAFLLGDISIRYEGRTVGVPIVDPQSNLARLAGRLMLQAREEGKSMEELGKDMQGQFMQAMLSDIKASSHEEPEAERPDDPALHAKITIQPKTNQLDDVQEALAKATGFTVVSDFFGGMGAPGSVPAEEAEIREILEKISELYRYDWEKHPSVVEFRDKKWYQKRAAQIPEAWIEGWRSILKTSGTLDISDLAQIAMLSYEQYSANIIPDKMLSESGLSGPIFRSRDLLRLYASLTESQRTMLFTEGGLDLRGLTPSQWQQAASAINTRNAGFLLSPDARLKLEGRRTLNGKQFAYSFSATTTEDLPPITWDFTTPKYKEPERKEEAPPEKTQ